MFPPVLHQNGARLIIVDLGEVLEEAEDRFLPPILLHQLSHGLYEVPPLGLKYFAMPIDRQTRLDDKVLRHIVICRSETHLMALLVGPVLPLLQLGVLLLLSQL